ncbi:MAG: FliH/SctL family protein [Lachnospiraceae bacterium]|nr:FliH/SctL family protein [Lachnospiraceae bacterium]
MSNLYKQRFVQTGEQTARVINSNQMVAEKIEELAKKMRRQADGEQNFTEGFSEGLQAEQVEEILQEPEVDYVAEAKAEAEQILAQAKAEADAILIEAENQKQTVLEIAKEEGKQRGYQEGQAKAEAESIQAKKKFDEMEAALQQQYREQLERMEPELVEVIARVFEKVFHIQFGDKTEILLALVSDAIMEIEGSKEFRIRVSNVNFEFMDSHKVEIEERVGNDVSLEIIADSLLEENQCTIETDSGMFDCSLGVQLENLIKDLKSLSID